MTVSTRVNKVSYRADGVVTTFDFSFFIPAGALKVYLSRAGAVEEVPPSHYRVLGLGYAEGGRVLFHAAPPEGIVTLLRQVPLTQEVALVNGAAFHARVLEEAFDKTAMGLQQLEERVERALVFGIGDTSARTLPPPLPGRTLKWNADGTGLTNSQSDPDAAAQAAAAAEQAAVTAMGARDQATQARDQATQARDHVTQARDHVTQARDQAIQARDQATQARDHAQASEAVAREMAADAAASAAAARGVAGMIARVEIGTIPFSVFYAQAPGTAGSKKINLGSLSISAPFASERVPVQRMSLRQGNSSTNMGVL